MWGFIKLVLIAICTLAAFFLVGLLFSCVIMPPIERICGRILPWWSKAFLASVAQAFLVSFFLYALLGFNHSTIFVIALLLGTGFFLWTNVSSGEHSSKDNKTGALTGCGKQTANHLCSLGRSVVDNYEGLNEVCGKPRGDGYLWLCEECLKKAGLRW